QGRGRISTQRFVREAPPIDAAMGDVLHHRARTRETKQRRADAADGLTSKRSFIEGSNVNDETKPADLWELTKAWADKNRTISGGLVGGAAGTILPGIGTVIGAIMGAGIGFASSKEKPSSKIRSSTASRLRAKGRSRTSSSSPKSNRRSAARDDRVN